MHTALAYPSDVSAAMCLHEATRALRAAGIESAALDARILLLHVLGLTAEEWLMQPERHMSDTEHASYQALLQRRICREPVSHLTGIREFWGRDFSVTTATLDPRPDSETLVEATLSHITDRQAPFSILDMGSGTGCLLLSLLHELPHAHGTCLDKSADALAIAQHNAARHGLTSRVQCVHQDWNNFTGKGYDIVISNPPYVPTAGIKELAPEVALHEPKIALDGGEDGLNCYREIFARLPQLLASNGTALFEIGMGQALQVSALANRYGFRVESIQNDMQGIARCIIIKPRTKD